MSDLKDFPRIPVRLPSWEETQRRAATAINYLLDWVDGLSDTVGNLEAHQVVQDARLDLLESLIVQLQPSGYGGGSEDADVAFDIPLLWATLPFDVLNPPTARGCVFTPATNNFRFTESGVWQLLVVFSLEGFTGQNSGRSFHLRLYDETDAVGTTGVVVGVGRNVEDLTASVTALFTITDTDVSNNHTFRVEAGGGDAISGGDLIASSIQVTYQDPLGGLL